jgi:predicted DNA-binding transcriptional regulator YafY
MAARLINRTERLAEIERLLLRHITGLRAVEIAEACGVDRRTVYRDLSLLNDIGVPIEQRDGRFFLDREHYAANTRLNLNEQVALLIAMRSLLVHGGQATPHLISALSKLARGLPESIAVHAAYVVDAIGFNAVDRAAIALMETVTYGWAEQVRVKLWYWESGQASPGVCEFATYFIEPGRMNTLYVIGFDYNQHQIKALNLRQLARAQLLQTRYHIPKDLDRRSWLKDIRHSAGRASDTDNEVVLAFAADIVPLVRRQSGYIRHHMKFLDDHRGVVRLPVTDWNAILPWIRSWGAQVEVLEPDTLRQQVAADAARVAAAHQVNN